MGMKHAILDRYDTISMDNLAEYIRIIESESLMTAHLVMLDGEKVYQILEGTYTVCAKGHGTLAPLEDVLDHLGVNGDQETIEDVTGCDFALWQHVISIIVTRHQNERDDIFAIVYG